MALKQINDIDEILDIAIKMRDNGQPELLNVLSKKGGTTNVFTCPDEKYGMMYNILFLHNGDESKMALITTESSRELLEFAVRIPLAHYDKDEKKELIRAVVEMHKKCSR